jgi:hypothetical protein
MVESAALQVETESEMDSECPRTVLAQGGTDFEGAEMDFALVEIADERAEMGSEGVGTEVDLVEMDWAGMDSPSVAVEWELLAPSGV